MGVDNPCFLQRKLNRIVFPVDQSSNLFDRNPDFGHPVHKIVLRCGDSTDNRDVRSVFDVSFVFIVVRRGCCAEGGPERNFRLPKRRGREYKKGPYDVISSET